jgi:phosphonate degradation associated HDIG domain protein
MSIATETLALFARRGADTYFGERVSISEHMRQAAHFAQQEDAPAALVLAALLHDIGHLLEDVPDSLSDWTTDAHHEEVGSRWLAERFASEVADPVRLHVAAKRYLCATEPAYFARLSEASVHTLSLQGGPMSTDEVAAFERQRFFREAIRVRRWDDQGKVVGLATPPLDHHRSLIEAQARRSVR